MKDLQVETLSPAGALEYFSFEALNYGECRKWVLTRLHPDGAYCPYCHMKIEEGRALIGFWENQRTFCKFCKKQFTAMTGTVLNHSSLDEREVVLFLFLAGLGIENRQIATILKVHIDTVKAWKKKLA